MSQSKAHIAKPHIAKPHIVILGAGFGGLFAARAMAGLDAHITLIDRHNYHLFQPLLYQVATAGLPPSDISWPVRSIVRNQRNVSVLMDEITGIDTGIKSGQGRVLLGNASPELPTLEYDYLVVATGSRHSYFGHDEWQEAAPGLKSIDDATLIRRRILLAFERSEMLDDSPQAAVERERLLRFVIVGGGPTGVELAGTIAELARYTLAADFRRIDPRNARVSLIEAGERILPSFQPRSSVYAERALRKLGVEVNTALRVTACDSRGVDVQPAGSESQRIDAATVIWAAGVKASPVGRWLGVETDRAGRVAVAPDLSVPGLDRVYVIGDAAAVMDSNGMPVPGIAPAAKQQGRYVARVIGAAIEGKPAPSGFTYRHAGNLATIGRKSAVIEFPGLRLKGRLAWWIWGITHIYFLLGVPSPMVISFRWLWEYLTYGRGARLITGVEEAD